MCGFYGDHNTMDWGAWSRANEERQWETHRMYEEAAAIRAAAAEAAKPRVEFVEAPVVEKVYATV